MLSLTVFLPLAGALCIALFVRRAEAVRRFALAVAAADFLLSLGVFLGYDRGVGGLQWVERVEWVPAFGIQYYLGVDGLSAPLVLLTGLLGLSAVLASWPIRERVREYFAWLLVLQTAVMGVFTALDLVLFFVFWELELVPMYFLIAVWGSGRKEYSAMKFLLFTLTGSAFMLVGILAVYFSEGTFDLARLAGLRPGEPALDPRALVLPAQLVFLLFFIAFAIKLPVWPVHTWLPDAHTDAPTAVSVMLAGVLLKMGGYGLLRINLGMFPEQAQALAGLMAALGVVSILYGAMVTLRQTDLKRLIAYSSVSHMGYVMLGAATVGATGALLGSAGPVGLTGASMQMFTHGTITGLLFLAVGVLHERTHTRHIPDLGGLASRMPLFAVLFVLAGLGSLGLPGLSGFVSEVLVFLGAFPVWGAVAGLAVVGVVLTAAYILWTVLRTMFGPARREWSGVTDATPLEAAPMLLLSLAIVAVGVYPAVLTDVFRVALEAMVQGRFLGS